MKLISIKQSCQLDCNNNNKKSYIMKHLGYKLYYYDNKIMYDNIIIPKTAVSWIHDQQKYYDTNKDNIAKELIFFITRYSLKPINYYLDNVKHDPNSDNVKYDEYTDKQIKILSHMKIDKDKLIKHLLKYIYLSPLNFYEFTIYVGINRKYYKLIKTNTKNNIFETKRIITGTFNKHHAIKYSHYRGKSALEKGELLILLKIIISVDTFCSYIDYENQILLPPKTHLKFGVTEFIKDKYKDISNNKYSELFDIEQITLTTIPYDYKKLYKNYKQRYITSKSQ